jgi:lysophospholipid acyltransferase
VGTVVTVLVLNFAAVPFMLLSVRGSAAAWGRVAWYGVWGMGGVFGVWAIGKAVGVVGEEKGRGKGAKEGKRSGVETPEVMQVSALEKAAQ